MKVTDGLEAGDTSSTTDTAKKVPPLKPSTETPGNNNNEVLETCEEGSRGDVNGLTHVNGIPTPPLTSSVEPDELNQQGVSVKIESEDVTTNGHDDANKCSKSKSNLEDNKSSINGTSLKSEQDNSEKNDNGGAAPKETEEKTDLGEDVFYVHDAGLTIKIVAPGAEPFEIQVDLPL